MITPAAMSRAPKPTTDQIRMRLPRLRRRKRFFRLAPLPREDRPDRGYPPPPPLPPPPLPIVPIGVGGRVPLPAREEERGSERAGDGPEPGNPGGDANHRSSAEDDRGAAPALTPAGSPGVPVVG